MNIPLKLLSVMVTVFFSLTACNDNNMKTAKTEIVTDNMKPDSKPGNMDEMKGDNGMMASMNTMMQKMSGMEMSGDFDMDFANMMIEHHQGAIDMSEEELKSGLDAKMKSMAQNIITAQKKEQGKLRDIIKNAKPMTMDMGKHEELNEETKAMAADMKNMQMTKNTDQDFARMMIFHHESAVEMSKAELSHGMNAELKTRAKMMIADQTKEITEFKTWLSENK
ncbi:MAG: DUF305 domain-containing protein [Ferruginibacter sp.]